MANQPNESNLLIRILANQHTIFDALADMATDSDEKKTAYYLKLMEAAEAEERHLLKLFTE